MVDTQGQYIPFGLGTVTPAVSGSVPQRSAGRPSYRPLLASLLAHSPLARQPLETAMHTRWVGYAVAVGRRQRR